MLIISILISSFKNHATKNYTIFFSMERYYKTWWNELRSNAGLYLTPMINLNSGSGGTNGVYNQPIVKQSQSHIHWSLNNTSGSTHLVFRVTIILSKAYFFWLPFRQDAYNPGLSAPPKQWLFDDYKPSSPIRSDVLPFIEVLYDKHYFCSQQTPIVFDEIFIDTFKYNWCKPNDFGPRYNGLWFLVTAVEWEGSNTFLLWTGGSSIAPSYSIGGSWFLEPSM